MKNIVINLRFISGISGENLFTSDNCELPESEKNYDILVKYINEVFSMYDISTCLQKAHFIAQVYHETDRLRTTLEYASGTAYNPGQHPSAVANDNTEMGDGPKYKGRGLMQLTWKKNYDNYGKFKNLNFIANYELVSNNMKYAVDSAGWFWLHGSAWGNLNEKANNDDIYYINIGVNGGSNGFLDRIKYIKKIIDLMDIKNCPNLKIKKPLGVYTLNTSRMKETGYVKNNKNIKERLEKFNDE